MANLNKKRTSMRLHSLFLNSRLRVLGGAVAAIALVASGTAASAPAVAEQSPQGPKGSDLPGLSRTLQPLVDEAAASGIRVSIGLGDLRRETSDVLGSAVAYNPASTIKLALLATVMRQADRGELSLDAPVTVSPYMVVGGSGTIQNESMPYTTTVAGLAQRMVTVSDNTATNVLLYYVGIPTVQKLLDDLGIKTMRFNRQMFPGTALSHVPQNVIDAKDTVTLMQAIYSGHLLSKRSTTQVIDWMLAQEVDTKFGAVLNDKPVAHKTGETGNVTHDVGYFLVPGHETIVAVFTEVTTTTSFSETQRIGNPIVQKIGLAAYEYLDALGGTRPAQG